ncbi:MAG: hypothetical protein NVS1B10_07760 [Candidatus Saccharimonadales bacterium]
MKLQAYILKFGDETVRATMFEQLDHFAILRLHGDIGLFRTDNIVRLNLKTLEISLYEHRLSEVS